MGGKGEMCQGKLSLHPFEWQRTPFFKDNFCHGGGGGGGASTLYYS